MTHTSKRFVKNSIWQLLLNIISKALTFVFVAYAVRIYGTNLYGKYAFVVSMVTLFYLFADLGLGTFMIREIARDKLKTNELFFNKLSINLISALSGYLVLIVVFALIKREEQVLPLIALAGISIILQAISTTFGSVFAGYERLDYNAMVEIGGNIVIYAASLLCIYLHSSITLVVGVYVLGNAIKVIMAWMLINTITDLHIKIEPSEWMSMIRGALPLFTIVIFYRIYFSIDSTILWYFGGNEAVGRYNPAFRFLEMTQSLPLLLIGALFPVMARFHVDDPYKLGIVFEKTLKSFMIVAVPLAAVSFLYAREIIAIIYGVNSDQGIVHAFQVLVWTIIFIYGDQLMGNFFIATDRQKSILPIVTTCALFNVIANVVLIPKIGIMGAAITSLLSEVMQFSIFFYLSQSYSCYRIATMRPYAKIGMVTIITVLMTLVLKASMNFVAGACMAISIYLILLMLFRIIETDELRYIASFVQRQTFRRVS